MASAGTAYVDVRGDFSALNRGIAQTTTGAKSKFKALGKVAALGIGAGLVGAAVALRSVADAAAESEKSQARLRAQLKASDLSYRDHAKQIESVIQAQSRLSGLDDEDLQDSFTNIVRVTGDVNKSLKLNAIAADLARAKNLDVAKAGEIVAKVAGGNTGILSRYGIQLEKNATTEEAVAALQKKVSGQAKAYGKTAAGAQDRFRVAVENLQEKLGERLLPILAKVANAAATFLTKLERGDTIINTIGRAIGDTVAFVERYKEAFIAAGVGIGLAAAALGGYAVATRVAAAAQALLNVALTANPIGLAVVAIAALAAGLVYAYQKSESFRRIVDEVGAKTKIVFEEIILPTVRRVIHGVGEYFKGLADVFRGVVQVVKGIIHGDFSEAFGGIKTIVRGVLRALGGIVSAATAPLRTAAAKLGGAIKGGIESAIRGVVGVVRGVVNGMIGVLNGFIGAVNTAIGAFNKLPGPNIGKVGKIGKIGDPNAPKPPSGRNSGTGSGSAGVGNAGMRPRAFAAAAPAGGISIVVEDRSGDPVATAVQTRRQIERAQRRYSNVNSPRQ